MARDHLGDRPTLFAFLAFADSYKSSCFKTLVNQLFWGCGTLLDDAVSSTRISDPSAGLVSSLHTLAEYEIDTPRFNAMYTQGIKDEIKVQGPITMMSCAPDKLRVNAIGLFNTPFVFPSNVAYWGHPQDTSNREINF